MDGRRITLGWKLAWLAAMAIPFQPVLAAANCAKLRCSSTTAQGGAGGDQDETDVHRPTGSCRDGSMCPDTTPTPTEPISRLIRRKQEWSQGGELLPLATEVVIKLAYTSRRAAKMPPLRPLSASEHCVSLCRLLL